MVFPTAEVLRTKTRVYSAEVATKEFNYVAKKLISISGSDLLKRKVYIYIKQIEEACDGLSEGFDPYTLADHISNFGYEVSLLRKEGKVIRIDIAW